MAPQNKNRNYAKEARWAATEEQKKRRAERNRARREAMEKGLVKKGDGKEVHHVKGSRRGKLSGPTKVVSRKENRSIQPDRPGGKRKK
jgi:hypothetical protein